MEHVEIKKQSSLIRLDPATIARAGASDVLALGSSSIGRSIVLRPANKVELRYVESSDDSPRKVAKLKTGEEVALVSIHGPLAQRQIADMCGYVDGYDAIVERFGEALSLDTGSVLIVIDSPGGDAAGLEEACRRMRAMADRSKKSVVVYVDEMAASAAYWIAAVLADEIYVPPAGQVGSIGCIGGFVDESEALKNEGVSVTLVRWPEGKAESHPYGLIADLALERTVARVKSYAMRFFETVAERRSIKVSAIEAMNGDMFAGETAVKAKLADKVGSFEDALLRAAKLGREARKNKGSTMSNDSQNLIAATLMETETENDRTVKALCAKLGVTSGAEMIGRVEAGIRASESLTVALSEVVQLKAERDSLKSQIEQAEANALIAAAEADMRIRPENKAKTLSLYQEYGLRALKAHLDALTPLAAATPKTEPVREPVISETSAVESVDVSQMDLGQKRAFIAKHGIEAYRAAKSRAATR